MSELILYNLQMVGYAILLLLGAWLANTILGMYFNVKVSSEAFDKKRLLKGVLKLFSVCIGTALVSIVITLFPEYLNTYGIGIGEENIETFSIIVIAGLYAVSIVKYIKECIGKLTEILK